MAYRRRQGMSRASTFKEDFFHPPQHDDPHDTDNNTHLNNYTNININSDDDHNIDNSNTSSRLTTSHTFSSSSSLAAQALRASAAHRESSLSSAHAADSIPQSFRSNQGFAAYEESSARNDSTGFWGVLARKAKAILDDDQQSQIPAASATSRFHMPDTSPEFHQSYLKAEGFKKMDNPTLRKGLDKITSSLNQIGDTFEKAFEEGRTIVENKTADIIQETRKLQIRRKGGGPEEKNEFPAANSSWQPLGQITQPQNQMHHETQLKASRDVAMATAAKAKLLLRELKTIKADLAFAKQRCSQLEEENKILRESREKGGNPADDDLIRLQLETLLAEKARLAHENSVYARENRFLREIVEYHQLTMQDVVYVDEGSEEVTEVYPFTKVLSISPPSPSDIDAPVNPPVTKGVFPVPSSSLEEALQVPASGVNQISLASMPK